MPYSLPVHSQGRAGHRRSYSQISSPPTTAGAFASLGDLPRRRSATNIPLRYPTHAPQKKPTFHFRQDEDEDEEESPDIDHDRLRGLPPLRLKIKPPSPFDAVPFPLSSPPLPPSVSRSSSTPTVLLSNGKPLKSSLKSSSSSPNIPFPSQSLVPSIMFPDLHPGYYKPPQQPHQRASSAPCTPLMGTTQFTPSPLSSPSRSPSPPASPPTPLHHVHKNVHFPSQEGGLATIRLFNRSARPASLSQLGEETETETEGEGSGPGAEWSGKYISGSTFPFPRVEKERKSPLSPLSSSQQKTVSHEVDWSQSSAIPRKSINLESDNVFFDSLKVVSGLDSDPSLYFLQGTVLVRNITYQKTVMVRYTIDEWETLNDVLGWYDVGWDERRHGVGGGGGGETWDRFKFSISLGELENRVIWFVGKYVAGGSSTAELLASKAVGSGAAGHDVKSGAGEWWDNNEGKNYKIAFRKVEEDRGEGKGKEEKVYKRGVVVSAPPTYTTPTSTLTRPRLSAPQISSSSSFPSSQEREKEKAAQHQAALTQSTLARLKKLNLKNYAAPRGYGYGQEPAAPVHRSPTPPVLTLTSASPTNASFVTFPSGTGSPLRNSPPPPPSPPRSECAPNLSLKIEMSSPTFSTTDSASTDSTPVQTPIQGDDEYDDHVVQGEGKREEEEDSESSPRWSLVMENGHFATTLISAQSGGGGGDSGNNGAASTPTPISYPRIHHSYTDVEMGTSPPFSDLGEGSGIGRGGSVYWDWGSAGAALAGLGGGEGGGEKEVGRYQRQVSVSGRGGLMPPQRRRHHQQQRGSGGSSFSSSSSSGSGSDSTAPMKPLAAATPSTPSSPPKTKTTPPKLSNLPSPPVFASPSPSPPAGNRNRNGNGVQSPKPVPTRYYDPQQQQRYGGHHYPTSLFQHSNPTSPPGSNDAIYQALVREWCFASGPGPAAPPQVVVGGGEGEKTPTGSPPPGLGMAAGMGRLTLPLSEGE